MYNTTKTMNRFYLIISFLFTLACVSGQQYSAPANPRATYTINSDWKLIVGDISNAKDADFDDASWKSITLPHAFNEDEAFRVHIEQLTDTVVWYRKHFRFAGSDKGKKAFLEFEGVRFAAEVYVNGKFIGLHENGVMAFGFDISSAINYDADNVIAVRVDNSWTYHEKASKSPFQWNNKNFNANYGGIPKNVFLHVTNPVYQTLPLYSNLKTTGTYIYASDFDIKKKEATINAESEIKNESSTPQKVEFEVVVADLDGKETARFTGSEVTVQPNATAVLSASSNMKNLHFWSWGYGYLYDVYTSLKIDGKVMDVVKTRTGFRKTEFKNGMVSLNDRVIQMKGYAQRTSNEWPGVGMSVPAWLSDYSNRLMVESNGNMVRWMHVTPWKQDVESCDRVGLMQMFPAGDAESDVKGRRWEQRTELMRDAIIYTRNNPSVILLECGNESISEEHMAEMKVIRDQYDPHGGRAIGSREMLDSKIAEYGGEMLYINHSAGKPLIATEYCRDEALRKYWDDFTPPFHKNGAGPLYRNADASDYNRNQDSFAKEDIIRWNDYFICRAGTGKRISSGGLNIVFSDTNTHCRGEENYRRSGEVDAMRIAKDAYYAHQVMWDGWVDVEKYHTYIIGHWTYAPGTVKDVMVVSPSDKVELFLNGKSIGIGEKSYNFLHTFKNVKYEAGELKAVSMDAKGKEQSTDINITTGAPAALKLTLINRPTAVKADGADMVLVQVEAVDAKGQRCPDVHPLVNFTLSGPAEWRGGIAQGKDNYVLSTTLPAECGVNRALIRTTTQAGNVTVSATSEGLKSDVLAFETVAVKTDNGLTTVLPSDGLPSNLSRGETPATPSFKVSRKAVDIVSATAGANADKVAMSYDDNELSEWTNDGKISTGWISYQLAQKVLVSEVCLKLTGWRSLSYQLEILVDKKIVWKGETPQSLGYVTIPLTPTKGKSLTIRLTGAGKEKDAFQNMIEVNGNKELDGFKDPKNKNTKGQLRIVEAEIYGKN
jgi:beta-galactosidase